MKKAATVFGLVLAVATLGGCPIWVDWEEHDGWECDTGCSAECEADGDCPDGYVCDYGFCEAAWACDRDGWCPVGYVCDDRNTCVPDVPTPCVTDADCPEGYCSGANGEGVCVDTGSCVTDLDCAVYGPGLACDERGICAPDEGPCPEGECGCSRDSDCSGENMICVRSRCTDSASVCVFDFECGADAVCLDNECHATCEDAGCPVGQECADGLCLEPEVGGDGCVYDEDCGVEAFVCINATCHPICADDEQCGDNERCAASICRADPAPVRLCAATEECEDGMECIRGVCRMPCAAPLNCADQGDMSVCDDGFCRFQSEMDSNCSRSSHCAEGAVCLDGQCATLGA